MSFPPTVELSTTPEGQRANTALQPADIGVLVGSQAAALLAATAIQPGVLAALITAYLVALPTTLPATSGVAWLNGGSVCIS